MLGTSNPNSCLKITPFSTGAIRLDAGLFRSPWDRLGRETLGLVSFSDPTWAFATAVEKSLAITIALEIVGHAHKFQANHGEARAGSLEFIVNSRWFCVAQIPAIKDKFSRREPPAMTPALLDDPHLEARHEPAPEASLEPCLR
jgi:hypothetical protein